MRDLNRSLLWLIAGLVAALAIVWLYPRVYPVVDRGLSIDRATAKAIALARLSDIGELPDDPYVIVTFEGDPALERRLQYLEAAHDIETLRASKLAEKALAWMITVYKPDARPFDWSYRAELRIDGQVLSLRRRVPEKEGGGAPTEAAAVERARAFLAQQPEVDRSMLAERPTVRRSQTGDRLDLAVRFRFRDPLADGVPHGVEVMFAGDLIAGVNRWLDDPDIESLNTELRPLNLVGTLLMLLGFAIVVAVAVPFLRRYHDGQLGMRRGVQLFQICFGASLIAMFIVGPGMSEGSNWGNVTRRQNTWVMGAVIYIFNFLVPALATAMVWPLGEWWARRRWPEKLAAFDAVFRLRFANATVARSAARGASAGIVAIAVSLAVMLALRQLGAAPIGAIAVDYITASALPAAGWIGFVVGATVPTLLFAFFLIPTWAEMRFGRAGILLAIVAATFFGPSLAPSIVPTWALLLVALVIGGSLLALYRYGDLLSMLVAGLLIGFAPMVLPALFSPSPWFQANGWIAVLVLMTPLIASIRHLGSKEEFHYAWDDVPLHVRRIAERERQRVELETARGIQQSILPDLPPQLAGVEIAHAYLPSSEVGGDFYDVLALDDGRLAVAVGDVAGHGVSSGLVMSMAKSALAVQVTFDPAVESVLATLNRMVFQSARARLLTTLCYALLDPRRGEVRYASAGHLFPYVVSPEGGIRALEVGAYPLGVRADVEPQVRSARIAPGGSLFLYSDGLVEATAHGMDEPFGFERLEKSLTEHARLAPGAMRDAVLRDLDAFTGRGPRADDLTMLILRLPAA